MPDTDSQQQNRLSARIARGAGVAAISLLIVAGVLAYYAWSYGPRDHFIRALTGQETLNPSEALDRTVQRFCAAIDGQRGLFVDFIVHYYPAGIFIYAKGIPSLGFYYSAFFALCLNLLSWLGLIKALYVWTGLQIVLVVLLTLVPALHFARRCWRDYYLYLALTLLCLPVLHNFMWGQVSVALTLCILGTLYFYTRGHTIGAALLLAVATSVKFYPAIFALYFLLKREFRLLAMFAAWTVVFLVVVPAARLGGLEGLAKFQRASQESIQRVSDKFQGDNNSQYLPHVLKRYFHVEDIRAVRSLYVPAYVLLAANLLLLCGVARTRMDNQAEVAFALLLLSTPLFVATSWPHYFAYLPFCQVLLWQMLRRGPTHAGQMLQYLLLAGSMVLASSVFFNQLDDFHTYSGEGYLLWSNLALLLLLYVQVVPAVLGAPRRGRAQPAGIAAEANHAQP